MAHWTAHAHMYARTATLQLQDIEQRQYREEQAALRHWDARLGLRTKTLQELRAMAQ